MCKKKEQIVIHFSKWEIKAILIYYSRKIVLYVGRNILSLALDLT